jgi:hypothetical protein
LVVDGIILTTCSFADATTDSIISSLIIADEDVIEVRSCIERFCGFEDGQELVSR